MPIRFDPIIQRAVRKAGWPSPRLTLILSMALSLGGSGLCAMLLFIDQNSPAWPVVTVVEAEFALLCLAIAILSVPISGVVTAGSVGREAESEGYQLLLISGLERRTIARGLLFRAIFHLRVLWLLTFGSLLPLLVVVLTLLAIIEISFACIDAIPGSCPSPTFTEAISQRFDDALLIVGLGTALGLALNWLAVNLGMYLALVFRRASTAMGATLAALFVVMIAMGFLYSFGPPNIVFRVSVAVFITFIVGMACYHRVHARL